MAMAHGHICPSCSPQRLYVSKKRKKIKIKIAFDVELVLL